MFAVRDIVGYGLLAALVVGSVIARGEPACRIVGLAAIAGAFAIIVDIFVL